MHITCNSIIKVKNKTTKKRQSLCNNKGVNSSRYNIANVHASNTEANIKKHEGKIDSIAILIWDFIIHF